MEVMKFKLIDGGRGGVTVSAKEFFDNGKFQVVDDVSRTRRIMLSPDILEEVGKLKYFFLQLTGHWIPPYSKYYDAVNHVIHPLDKEPKSAHILLKELWQKVEITGASVSPRGFVITGKMEVLDGKWIGMATPLVGEDDDFGFFIECMKVLSNIAKNISGYLKSGMVPLEQAKNIVPVKEQAGKSDKEIGELAMQYLMDRGAIIMMDGQEDQKAIETDQMEPQVKSNGNIDSKNLSQDVEVAESEEQDGIPEGYDGGADPVAEDTSVSEDPAAAVEPEGDEPVIGVPKDEPVLPQDEAVVSQPEVVDPYGPPAAKIPEVEPVNIPNTAGEDLSALEHSENMGMVEDVEPVRDEAPYTEPEW